MEMTFEMVCSVLLDLQPGLVQGEQSSRGIPHAEFVATARRIFPLMAQMMSPDEMHRFVAGQSTLWPEFEAP